MHPRAKRPLARPVKTGFFSPRQRCINTSSLPDFPSVISAVFRCTHHIPIQSCFTQLQSSVRGYVWRDKFYGTVRNIWPPMQSHFKPDFEKDKFDNLRGWLCGTFKFKFKFKVVTPRDTLHIEPILHLGPVGLLRTPGDGRTVNAYAFSISFHSSEGALLIKWSLTISPLTTAWYQFLQEKSGVDYLQVTFRLLAGMSTGFSHVLRGTHLPMKGGVGHLSFTGCAKDALPVWIWMKLK